MDFNVGLSNGKLLNGIVHSPGENPSGVVILVHGIGEHIRRYDHWAKRFKKENFAFAGLDLPGHGRSEGKRGRIRSYAVIYETIDILLKSAGRTFPGVPIFIYGHSLGGGIVLDYILRKNPSVRGAIVTGPWLKLAFEPSKLKVIMSGALKAMVPGLVVPSGLNIVYLSHDETVIDAYKKDPLVHDKVSIGLFTGALSSARYSLSHASELKIRTLIVHGSDDMICSPEGSREFSSKTSMAELKIWEGGYHELHNEPFGEEVFSYIMGWMRKQLTGQRNKDGTHN